VANSGLIAIANPSRKFMLSVSHPINAGLDHGAWIECDALFDGNDILEEIQEKILATSPIPDAEKWSIHSSENWYGIEVAKLPLEKIATLGEAIAVHGEAVAKYYLNVLNKEEEFDHVKFQNTYIGEYEDEETFVVKNLEQRGLIADLETYGLNTSHLDLAAIAWDWFGSNYISFKSESGHRVFVFHRETT
jgi:antirestriction protein